MRRVTVIRQMRGLIQPLCAAVGALTLFAAAGCGKDEPEKSAVARPRLQACDYGMTIFFGAGGDSERFKLLGWSGTEGPYTWTDGIGASLGIKLPHSDVPVRMNLKAAGMNAPGRLPFQPVDVSMNGEKIASWEVAEEKVYTAIIPQRLLVPPETFFFIDFYMPKASSPGQLGQGPDGRRLGLRVVDLRFEKAPDLAGNAAARP